MISSRITYRTRHASLLLAGTALVLGAFGPAHAEVTFEPLVEIEESITDNAFSSGSEDRQMDFITTATAGFEFDAKTRRTEAGISYKLNRDIYKDNSELNGTRHDLLADGKFELIEDWLRIEGDASISEENIGSVGDLTATDRSTASSEQSQIINYSVGPVLEHDFNRHNFVELSYKYSVVDFSKTDAASESANSAQPGATVMQDVELEFGVSKFEKFEWTFSGSYSDSDQEETGATTSSSDTRIQKWNGETRILSDITRSVRALGEFGWDHSNAASVEDRQNGFYYFLGVRLNMADRLEGDVLIGNRFDERTVNANLTYSPSERTTVGLTWDKKIQTQQQELATGATRDANGQLVSANNLVLQFVDQTALTETFKLDFSHQRSERTSYGAGLTVQSRNFSGEDSDEVTATLQADIKYRLSRKLTSEADISFTDTVATRTANSGQTTVNLGGELSYDHNDSLKSSLSYNYLVRRDDAKVDVRENVLSLKLSKTF